MTFSSLMRVSRPYGVFLLIGASILISWIDPAFANIFAKPIQKAQAIKQGLMTLAKVSVAIALVGCFCAALAGRVNWKWVGVVAFVAIALATFDVILGFLEIG